MPAQNYANHRRFFPLHHYFAAPLAFVATVWSFKRLFGAPSADNIFFAVIGLALLGTVFAARAQALAVQNRVIRLEMQLRLARLLPADLMARVPELSLRHLISLRFAGDGELPDLMRRVLAGELGTSGAIKQAIRDWQPDELRA